MDKLDEIVLNQGPFYGILGYSQGSAFVAAYLAHAPANTFQVAAMFAGYLPTTHEGVLADIRTASPFNDIPAVVFMGGNDNTIANGMTREQASVYTNPLVLRSANVGHDLPPPSDPTFDQVVAFIHEPSGYERPTGEPTGKPTATPTEPPTAEPTESPTAEQTAEPTGTPTAEPTGLPTAEQTDEPTGKPTAKPDEKGDGKDDTNTGKPGEKGDGKDNTGGNGAGGMYDIAEYVSAFGAATKCKGQKDCGNKEYCNDEYLCYPRLKCWADMDSCDQKCPGPDLSKGLAEFQTFCETDCVYPSCSLGKATSTSGKPCYEVCDPNVQTSYCFNCLLCDYLADASTTTDQPYTLVDLPTKMPEPTTI
jgi:hypothetical protein